jgi:integrase
MSEVQQTRPAEQAEGGELWVSNLSRYADDVWQFQDVGKNVKPSQARVDWAVKVRNAGGTHKYLTDLAWRPLLNEAKAFLWSLHADPPGHGRRASATSLIQKCIALRVLIQWMAENGIVSFNDLDPHNAEAFLEYVQAKQRERKGRDLSAVRLGSYTRLLKDLFLQAEKVGSGPRSDPFPGENAGQRAGRQDASRGALPATPDEVAKPLILGAIRLIGTPADDVIALRDAAQAAHDASPKKRSNDRSTDALRTVKGWTFSVLEGESAPWHAPITSLNEVGRLERRIADAAYVVISYLCGPRDSEMAGLRAGCVERGIHTTSDGLENIAYIKGDIRKTDEPGHRWVAPPEAVRAVEVMERLCAPMRERSGRAELFLTTNTHGLMGPGAEVQPIANYTMTRRLNELREFLELPYYNGEPWHLTTHQGRKTFARFVARKDKTNLYALQKQLGHVTRAMTDQGYVGSDPELLEDILRENWSETEDLLTHLFMQDSLAGEVGKRIERNNPFQGRTKDPDEVREFARSILYDTEMNIAPCDWGLCLYRKDTSKCGGDDNGPNRVYAAPSVCAGCKNFVMSEKHRPYWENRKTEAENILADPRTDDFTAMFCRERVRESQHMLAQIDQAEG